MGSVNDFLFQGKPPPKVNSNSTTTTQVPAYLQQYHEGVLARANKIAAQPYQTYKGQRLADVSPALQQSWDATAGAANSYQPAFNQASGLLGQAAGYSASGAASPWLASAGSGYNTASNYAAQGANANVTGAAQPFMGAAMGSFNSGLDYAGNAAGKSISGAAQPYMQQAGQNAYSNVNAYMSPYQTAVVDQIGKKGQENLQNSLHTMGDDFIKAGGLGSSRHMSAAGKAMSDTQEAVSNAQSQALNQGYQTALGAAQNDMSRQAQLAQLSGQFAQNEATNQLNAGNLAVNAGQGQAGVGQTMGNLAQDEAQNKLNAANAQSNIAQGQTQAGQVAGNMQSIDQQNTVNLANANIGLGKANQTAGLTGAAAMEAVGRDQMGLEQQSLDLAYQDWAGQKDYNRNNADWMATLTRGQPSMGGTVYSDENEALPGAQYQPSGLQQIVGGLSLANGLSGLFKAKGGYIDAAAVSKKKPTGYATVKRRPPPVRLSRREMETA